MTLASKLSARWARIYQQPIDNLAYKKADFVNMAYSINAKSVEDYITRRWLLKMSRAYLQVLEKRLMDAIRILYMNPAKCFSRKNGKNYTTREATRMLDGRLEVLGTMFEKQYSLIKGVLDSDNKKYKKSDYDNISDEEMIKILVSKYFQIIFD